MRFILCCLMFVSFAVSRPGGVIPGPGGIIAGNLINDPGVIIPDAGYPGPGGVLPEAGGILPGPAGAVIPGPSYPGPGYPAPGYPAPGYPAPGYPGPAGLIHPGGLMPGLPVPGFHNPGYPGPGGSSRVYCTGQEDCCPSGRGHCGVGEGDCDTNDDCRSGLECGSNNCKWGWGIKGGSDGWDEEDDCCFDPKTEVCRGGEACCRHGYCGEGEGDCDIDSDCKPGLKCGHDNCIAGWGYGEGSEGWDEKDDCCYDPKKHTDAVCSGGEGCCESGLCDVGEGDCDVDSDCQAGLKCGTNNCILGFGIREGSLSWDEEDDCCFDPSKDPGLCIGGEDCCSHGRCGIGEGDCDYHSDCMRGLKCGENNCEYGKDRSELSPRWDRGDDCCYDPDGRWDSYGRKH